MERELLKILKDELVPAMGCTEPIAIAYGAAMTRKLLGKFPSRIVVRCSGNIIKNVKSVIVPGTGSMKGIQTSAVLGCIAGKPEKKLEVLSDVTKEDVEQTKTYLKRGLCSTELVRDVDNLYIDIEMSVGEDSAEVIISDMHTNIIKTVKNGKVIFEAEQRATEELLDISKYSLDELYQFACEVDKIK